MNLYEKIKRGRVSYREYERILAVIKDRNYQMGREKTREYFLRKYPEIREREMQNEDRGYEER